VWLTLLLRNWYWIAIISLSAALTLTTLRGQVLKAELGEKIAVIESMRNAAQTYQENSQRIAKEIKDAHAELLVAVENQAYENARKKFGTVARCPAVGLGTRGLLPNSGNGDGQAGSATGTGDIQEPELMVTRQFIEECARDSGVTKLWNDWCVRNALKGCE